MDRTLKSWTLFALGVAIMGAASWFVFSLWSTGPQWLVITIGVIGGLGFLEAVVCLWTLTRNRPDA